MSHSLNNFQEYFREIEAEMKALKAAVQANEEPSRPVESSTRPSTIGGIPVMHFQGSVEPFALTGKQLETVRVCWNDVQGFLSVIAGTSHSSQGQQKPVDKAARPRRSKTRSSPIMPCLLNRL